MFRLFTRIALLLFFVTTLPGCVPYSLPPRTLSAPHYCMQIPLLTETVPETCILDKHVLASVAGALLHHPDVVEDSTGFRLGEIEFSIVPEADTLWCPQLKTVPDLYYCLQQYYKQQVILDGYAYYYVMYCLDEHEIIIFAAKNKSRTHHNNMQEYSVIIVIDNRPLPELSCNKTEGTQM